MPPWRNISPDIFQDGILNSTERMKMGLMLKRAGTPFNVGVLFE